MACLLISPFYYLFLSPFKASAKHISRQPILNSRLVSPSSSYCRKLEMFVALKKPLFKKDSQLNLQALETPSGFEGYTLEIFQPWFL